MYKDIRVNTQVQLGLPFFSWSTCLYEVILSSYLRFFLKNGKTQKDLFQTYLLHPATSTKSLSPWSPPWLSVAQVGVRTDRFRHAVGPEAPT